MNELKEHTIAFTGLNEGLHKFQFELGQEFFDRIGTEDLRGGKVEVDVTMEVGASLLITNIHVEGSVNLSCDHCNAPLDLPLHGDQRQIFQLNAEEDLDDDELIGLSASAHSVNMTQYIYECLQYALPVRRVHPEGGCDPEMEAVLVKLAVEHEPMPDPRWAALKDLKKERP